MTSRQTQEARFHFSLIEVILAVAICAVVTNSALPPITASLHDAQLRTHAVSLYSALNTARMSAVMRGTAIVMCPAQQSAPDTTCAAPPSDWSNGVITYIDLDGKPGFSTDTDQLLGEVVRFPNDVQVAVDADLDSLTFFPDGGTSSDRQLAFTLRKLGAGGGARAVAMSPRGQLSFASLPAETL